MNVKAFLQNRLNRQAVLSNIKWNFFDRCFSWISRAKLKNKNFTIFGNNCFVGGIYHKFGLRYNSPTIWTYIFPSEYLRFLENLDWYLKQRLEFISDTKHSITNKVVENLHHKYPIGLLGGDVEIHFMHCKTEKQAFEKWNRRLKRINTQAMFFLFSDGWEFEDELLERFDKLPFEHKLFICEKPRNNKAYTAYVEGLKQDDVNIRARKFEKKVDLVKWLNAEPHFIKSKNGN